MPEYTSITDLYKWIGSCLEKIAYTLKTIADVVYSFIFIISSNSDRDHLHPSAPKWQIFFKQIIDLTMILCVF